MNSISTRPGIVAALITLLCLAGLLVTAPVTAPLNCDMECGETLLSLSAAHQYRAYGIDYGLLENLGTHEAPAIYTHNVNIGTLTFVGLEALGVPDTYKFLLPLAAFGLGLAYVFLAVRRISGDTQLGLVTLLLFSTTYWGLGAFGSNALRAWHLAAIFMVIHHVYGVARLGGAPREWVGLCAGAIVAFGCGYDFWIICAGVALLVGMSNLDSYKPRQIVLFVIGLAAIFATPFLLRQVHVAWAMGLSFWAQDFIYSVAIKVPYASDFIAIPSLDVIDAYYREKHVLRPPASPSNSASQIFFTFRHMITSVTVPRWGLLSMLMLGAVLLSAAIPPIWKSSTGRFIRCLILPVAIGIAIGLVIFAPFSLHVYFKHEFPLIAVPLLLAKGVVVSFFLTSLLARRAAWKMRAAAAVLAILAVDMAMVHWNNSYYGPVLNFGWGKYLKNYPNEKVGLATYALLSPADPYIGIEKDKTVYVTPTDMLGDRAEARVWVYTPFARFVDFDSAVPLCNWTGWLRQLLHFQPVRDPAVNCIYDQPLSKTAVRQPSVDEMIAAAAEKYAVVAQDRSTNGYVIFERKQK